MRELITRGAPHLLDQGEEVGRLQIADVEPVLIDWLGLANGLRQLSHYRDWQIGSHIVRAQFKEMRVSRWQETVVSCRDFKG